MSAGQPLRIGDAERDNAAAALGEHYATGRLTKEEYEERAERVWAARFQTDLEPLFVDLPGVRRPPQRVARLEPQQRAAYGWQPPFPFQLLLPGLAVAAIAAVIIAGMPWLLFGLFWLWAFAGGGHRRRRGYAQYHPATVRAASPVERG